MLELLFGSQNVQKVLIFLLVNGKCYGTQLHRLLRSPLTPIQKALLRLEKGGVVASYYEGKTRVYQFNPAYPLNKELEGLLKSAYNLLPPQEKKLYWAVKETSGRSGESSGSIPLVHQVWDRLTRVQHLRCHAKRKSKEEEWQGQGTGEVVVIRENDNVLIFKEKGHWESKESGTIGFSNIFRWTLDRIVGMISLEHLRRGINHPVFLFHLAPKGNHTLSSLDSHVCGEDAYLGQIVCDRHSLRLNWRVIGPQKNEEIDCYYI
jgi:hypothetical protein